MINIDNFVDMYYDKYIRCIDEDTFDIIWEGYMYDTPISLNKFEISGIDKMREGEEPYPIVFKLAVPSRYHEEMAEKNQTWAKVLKIQEQEHDDKVLAAAEAFIATFYREHPTKICTQFEWDLFSDIYKDARNVRPSSEGWNIY